MHDMILYIKKQKNPHETVRTNSKVAGYKVNIQKSVAFFWTNNKISEREIKKTIPFTIIWQRIIYLGISLTKEVKDLYSINYKTLMKEMEEDTEKRIYYTHVLE